MLNLKTDIKKDLVAGLTVGVLLIPQGMAYASLAGMPPIYGLYGGLVPLIVYALLGSSLRLSIGPVAISSMLIVAGISQLAEPMSPEYIQLVILAGLLIGVLQVIMSLLRLGFLVNFLSNPVILGFTSAAAVIIIISQLKDFLGIQIPRFSHPKDTLLYVWNHLQEINYLTFLTGLGGIVLIILFQRINKRIPAALITMIIGILIVRGLHLEQKGIQIIGQVPGGLPAFKLMSWNWDQIVALMPTVLTVCLIGIVESISIAKYLEQKRRDHTIRPNQELLAIGASKMIGSFFQSLPTSASFSRSAINDEVGARSQWSAIFTAGLIGLTLLFFTSLFHFLPKALLAAVILTAIWKLLNVKEAIRLWKVHRSDFFMLLITFVITLIFGIKEGVLAGVVLSMILMVFRSSRPHVAVLGLIPETTQYRNIRRFPEAIQDEEILILRFDAPLFFGNAMYFKDAVLKRLDRREKVKLVLLDASSIYDIDATGLDALDDVLETIRKKGKNLYISGVLGPVRDRLYKAGLMEKIGLKNQFLNIHQATVCFRAEGAGNWKPVAVQTNEEE